MSSEITDNNNQAKCPMSLDEIDLFAPGAQNIGMTPIRFFIMRRQFIEFPVRELHLILMVLFYLNTKI